MFRAFYLRYPRWIRWNIAGKVGGFAGAVAVGFAFDTAISAIFGSIEKGKLQGMILESLDCRFMAEKVKQINVFAL